MKIILSTCALIALNFICNASAYKQTPNIIHKTIVKSVDLMAGGFNVYIDNFRPQDDRQHQFNYAINLDYFEDDGPLYFYINDAGIYTTEWIEHGLMVDIAQQTGGALLTADHRYYGLNIPTERATWEDFEYLTIEQSLADIAFLIDQVKEQLDDQFGKVVVWGSGYGATLAVWARQKYPHLIDGVWSSSAVFLRQPYTTAFFDHLEWNIRAIGGDECGDNVQAAFVYMANIIDNGNENQLIQLQEELGLCDPVNITSSVEPVVFFEVLIDLIASHIAAQNMLGLNNFCAGANALPANPFGAFARWVRFTFNTDIGPCINLDYDDRLLWTSHEDWDVPQEFFGWRQSLYLICTQLGLFRITRPGSMFGNRIHENYHQQICHDAFGDNYDYQLLIANIDRLHVMHGGIDPSIENAVFTNGELDPFFPLGIIDNMEEDSISINLPFYGRSADLHSIQLGDSLVLVNAKNTIIERVTEWSATAIAPGKVVVENN